MGIHITPVVPQEHVIVAANVTTVNFARRDHGMNKWSTVVLELVGAQFPNGKIATRRAMLYVEKELSGNCDVVYGRRGAQW